MLEACITNLGKYNEGELDYARVTFPTDSETLAKAFEDIGMDFQNYEEFFISDMESSSVAGIHHFVGEYTDLDELNYFATKLEEMNPHDHEYIADLLYSECSDLRDAINLLDSQDSFIFMPEVFNDEDLGRYYIEEAGLYDLEAMGNLANYIDYEAFGRDIALDGYGVTYGANGCIQQVDDVSTNYTGEKDIPDNCRITGEAMHIVQGKLAMKNTELDTEEGYSFIDGVRNNIKPEKDESKGNTSIRDNLKSGKESIAKQDKENQKPEKPKVLGGDER